MITAPLLEWQKRARRDPSFAFVRSLEKLPRAEVYLVGGFVRDLLLKRKTKDIDIVVGQVSRQKLVRVLKKHGTVSFVGRTFGVFKFTPKGKRGDEAFDIALPRIDLPQARTGAYRDVRVQSRSRLPIEEDLKRRDFTVNALAWSITNKKLIDVGHGLADLKNKTLRTMGDPETRYREDFSRMLRALRFAAQLDFSIEQKSWRALKKLIRHLNDKRKGVEVVPRETIAKELLKALYEDPSLALELYDKSGALDVLIPEMRATKTCPQPKPYHMEGTVWRHTVLAMTRFTTPLYKKHFPDRPDAEILLTALLHDIAKPATLKTPRRDGVDRVRFDGHDYVGGKMAREIIERLKLSSLPTGTPLHVNVDHVEWLIAHHLLLLHDRAREMKLTTIERYFLRHPAGQKLQQLILVDSLGTIPRSGRPVLGHLYTLWKVLSRIQDHGSRHAPESLLKGDDIMRILNIPSGPNVGLLLRRLREEQLLRQVRTRRQAIAFIKKEHAI